VPNPFEGRPDEKNLQSLLIRGRIARISDCRLLLVSVISPAPGPTMFSEPALRGNCRAASHPKNVKLSFIIHWIRRVGPAGGHNDIGRWSKLEIDTWNGRDFAKDPGEVFWEFRREAGRRGGVRGPGWPGVRD